MADIKAVLFDLDGVLVGGKAWHRDALSRALKQICGITLDEKRTAAFEALPTRDKLKMLVDSGDMHADVTGKVWELKQKFTIDIIEANAAIDQSKVVMHQWLRSQGTHIACVTNCIRETAEMMLEKTGQLEHIELLVSNQDVAHAKPCAEGYVVAMVKLGVVPCECVIIEDSDKGIAAGLATGAHVMKVRDADALDVTSLKRFIRVLP